MADIFDTVSSQPTAAQPPQGSGSKQGDIFDQVASGASTGTTANRPGQTQTETPSFVSAVKDAPLDFAKGVGKGVLTTTTGLGEIIHKTGEAIHPGLGEALIPASGLQAEDMYSHPHGAAQTVGDVGETVGEFLLGDEALKGLSLSERLSRTAKVAKVLESHPLAAKAFQIGVNALRQGTVQGVSAGVKDASFSSAGKQGALGAGLTGAFGIAGETAGTIHNALDPASLQKPFQDGIRSLLGAVADSAGVTKPTAPSIRDAAADVADGVKAKASGLYQTLDSLSGGQAQRYRDAAKNISDKLSEIVGLDDEQEARLIAKQADIEAAHKAMLDKLAKQGVDPDTLSRADAAWKHQSALTDLSNAIRQSTTGLRPELAIGTGAGATPEAVNPKTLFTKVNRLNDRGRLAQAIGQDHANALLRHIDSAYVQAQRIAARNKFAATAAKTLGISGATAAGIHWAHDLLGAQ